MIGARPRPASAPATDVPLRYLVASAAAFIAAALGVACLAPELSGHYYHPRVVALTHTVTLGWVSVAIMGASYQIVPIVLERPVWSERLARWQFWVLLVGLAGMVAHFAMGGGMGLVASAAVLAVGIALHLYNVLRSLRGFDRWTFTARLVVVAYAGLGLTVVFGLLLGTDRVRPFLPGEFFPRLHAHVHLALLGWIGPMLLGVAARVYPMFLVASEPTGWPARAQLWGLVAGGPAVALGLLLGAPVLVGGGAIAAAIAAAGHLTWVARIVRGRRRPQLDWGLRLVLIGAAYLVPGALTGLGLALDVLSGPRLALAYAVLVLGGWISLTIAGMLLKIVPFLVWYRVYASRAGTEKVPALAALGWRQAEAVACVFLGAGMAGLAAAVGAGDVLSIRAAGAVVSVGALALGAALGRILWHLVSSRRAGTSRHARPIAEAPAQGNRIVAPAALTARTATTSAMPAAGAPAAAAAARR